MNALDAMKRALEEYPGRNPQQLQARKVCEGVLALAATLTQQQGGEQEARELLALECGFDPDSCGKFEGAVVSEAGALRAIAAALQAGTPT